MGQVSPFVLIGGLIQTALGKQGGKGHFPLNRFGLARKAISRVFARAWYTVAAWSKWTVAGVM